jgi:hypothetical protein
VSSGEEMLHGLIVIPYPLHDYNIFLTKILAPNYDRLKILDAVHLDKSWKMEGV